jgi:hypothetical protein
VVIGNTIMIYSDENLGTSETITYISVRRGRKHSNQLNQLSKVTIFLVLEPTNVIKTSPAPAKEHFFVSF